MATRARASAMEYLCTYAAEERGQEALLCRRKAGERGRGRWRLPRAARDLRVPDLSILGLARGLRARPPP